MEDLRERMASIDEQMKDMHRTIATLRFRGDVAKLLVHMARRYAEDLKANKFNVPRTQRECEQWAASQFCRKSFRRLCDDDDEEDQVQQEIDEGNPPTEEIETSPFRFHRATKFWRALGIEAKSGICICGEFLLLREGRVDAAFCRDLIETCEVVDGVFTSACDQKLVAQIARVCLARFLTDP